MRREILETLAEQIRHSNKECAPVSRKSWLVLAVEGIETVTIQIVVVTSVKSGSRAWRPAEKSLAGVVFLGSVVIKTKTRE